MGINVALDFVLLEMMDPSPFKRKWLDVPYANQSSKQKLDIYLPEEGDGPFPVIVAIHGGAWALGNKRDMQLAPMLESLKQGFAVVSVGYRLSDEALFPAQIYARQPYATSGRVVWNTASMVIASASGDLPPGGIWPRWWARARG